MLHLQLALISSSWLALTWASSWVSFWASSFESWSAVAAGGWWTGCLASASLFNRSSSSNFFLRSSSALFFLSSSSFFLRSASASRSCSAIQAGSTAFVSFFCFLSYLKGWPYNYSEVRWVLIPWLWNRGRQIRRCCLADLSILPLRNHAITREILEE